MNLQGRDLEIGQSGDDVRLLQTELALIGLQVPDDERACDQFGSGTCDAVISFQKDQNLEPTGKVDAVTAKAINDVVDACTYTVAGTVTSPDSASVGGLIVHIVDKNVGQDIQLTNTTTDAVTLLNSLPRLEA